MEFRLRKARFIMQRQKRWSFHVFYGFAQNLNWHSIGVYITKEVLECNSFEYSLKQGSLRSLMVNTEKEKYEENTSLESIGQEI